MRSSDVSIGEALTRIAETFGKLVVQHIQLLRSEVESEGRELARKGRQLGLAIAKAAPFIVGGIVVASLALGQILGLLVEPWLGRYGAPAMTLLLGSAEVLLAGRWLKTHLPAAGVGQSSPQATTSLPKAPPDEPGAPKEHEPTQMVKTGPAGSAGSAASAPRAGQEDRIYGAMG